MEERGVGLDDLPWWLLHHPPLHAARLLQLRAKAHLEARAHHAARLRAALRHHGLQRRQPRSPLQLAADPTRERAPLRGARLAPAAAAAPTSAASAAGTSGAAAAKVLCEYLCRFEERRDRASLELRRGGGARQQ